MLDVWKPEPGSFRPASDLVQSRAHTTHAVLVKVAIGLRVGAKQACSALLRALLRKRTKLYLICDLPLSAGHRRIDEGCCRSVSTDLPGTPSKVTPAYSATVSGDKFSPATS
eukprot:432788-Prymnesium_polylepis.1